MSERSLFGDLLDLDTMSCPMCGDQYVHLDGVEMVGSHGQAVRLGAPPEESSAYPTVAITSASVKTRRHTINLLGWCEGCGPFVISLNQHKGETYVSVGPRDDLT